LHRLFQGKTAVYFGSMLLTFIVSFFDGLNEAGINIQVVDDLFSMLPLYSVGLGWIVPAIVGGLVGYSLAFMSKAESAEEQVY